MYSLKGGSMYGLGGWRSINLWRKQRHAFACFVVADRRSVSICIVLLDHVHQFDREASHIETPNQKPGDVVKLLCKIFMWLSASSLKCEISTDPSKCPTSSKTVPLGLKTFEGRLMMIYVLKFWLWVFTIQSGVKTVMGSYKLGILSALHF